MEVQKKYFGILKNFDFDNIDKTSFQHLIDIDVIVYQEELQGEQLEEEKQYLIENPYCVPDLSNFWFIYNLKHYSFNPKIYSEMEKMDSDKIIYFSDAENLILKIEHECEKAFKEENQIKILEKHYSHFYSKIAKCSDDYLLYINGTGTSLFETFSDIYYDNITGSGDTKMINDFLKGKDYFYNQEMREEWALIYKVSQICKFCKTKLKKIENPTFENKLKPDAIEPIFKDDGLDVFNYLLSKYQGKKNNAFFSYLYGFLKENNKILKPVNDNKNYRNFIEKKYCKISRIIVSEDYSATKIEMINFFNQQMKTYSVPN